jgi:hypothetical protein
MAVDFIYRIDSIQHNNLLSSQGTQKEKQDDQLAVSKL